MATLHLLSDSPFTGNSLISCLRFLSQNDGLMLTGDAVYAVQPETAPYAALQNLAEGIGLFALAEDLEARALSAPSRMQVLDYAGFVELCIRYNKVNSWL